MNTNTHLLNTPSIHPRNARVKSTCFLQVAKSQLPKLLYNLVALLVGLFVTAAPLKAQSVTPLTYMNELYTWWSTGNNSYTAKVIHVRATFLGGSAHPAQAGGIPSMAIFQGEIVGGGTVGNFGAFVYKFNPIASGTGIFYNVGDLEFTQSLQYPPLSSPVSAPFTLSSLFNKLYLRIDLSGIWSNAKSLTFEFDKITSPNGWPSGNWTGLNGGVGSATGEVTLACSVQQSDNHIH
jgi:hypothetical protein